MKKRITLNEFIPLSSMTDIFTRLESTLGADNCIKSLDGTTLAYDYLYNHAYSKPIGRLLNTWYESNLKTHIITDINDAQKLILSGMIKDLYEDKWAREWDALNLTYGVIDNTNAKVVQETQREPELVDAESMTYGQKIERENSEDSGENETLTHGLDISHEMDANYAKTETETLEHGLDISHTVDDGYKREKTTQETKNTTTTTTHPTTTHYTAAFDAGTMQAESEDVTPENTEETVTGGDGITETETQTGGEHDTQSGTDTRTRTETQTGGEHEKHSGSDTTTKTGNRSANGSETHSGTDQRKVTHSGYEWTHYEETRTGNIGVTTSQQMLESEFKFREAWRMQNVIYSDLDRLLCLPCYA